MRVIRLYKWSKGIIPTIIPIVSPLRLIHGPDPTLPNSIWMLDVSLVLLFALYVVYLRFAMDRDQKKVFHLALVFTCL